MPPEGGADTRGECSVVPYGNTCVELHLGTGAVAQINATPDGTGFGIRVWQPRGTYSQTTPEEQENEGLGHNLTNLWASISFDADGTPRLDFLDYRATNYAQQIAASNAERRARNSTEEAKRERAVAEAKRLRERAAEIEARLTTEEADRGA
jgi:hypothetical protein